MDRIRDWKTWNALHQEERELYRRYGAELPASLVPLHKGIYPVDETIALFNEETLIGEHPDGGFDVKHIWP